MHRFIALVWNPEDDDAVAEAGEITRRFHAGEDAWATAFATPGLEVLHKDGETGQSRAYQLENNSGVILGILFRAQPGRSRYDVIAALKAREVRQTLETDGQFLIENFWGRYIAFLTNVRAGKSIVLRDPSGRIPCHHTSIGRLLVYASHVADLLHFPEFRPAINGRFLLANILVRELTIRQTGLAGITGLLPGESHHISRGEVRRVPCWKPAAICRSGTIEDFAKAAAALRAVTHACVAAWTSLYPNILHCLSGGIDSAIVLACLRHTAPTDVLCLNYRTAASDGDERPFARRAARALGFPLLEVAMPPVNALMPLLSHHPFTAAPEGGVFARPTEQLMAEVAATRRAEAITTGEGGDHLFFQMRTVLVAADAVRAGGSLGRLLRSVGETAHWTGRAYWPVLCTALKYGLLRQHWMPESECNWGPLRFVRRDAVHALPESYVLHPWLEGARGIAPGKAFQIHLLPKVLSRPNTLLGPEGTDILHPLLSQPLIELVLRIPSHVLTHGGKGRALARAAFARDLPAAILARRTKGGTTSYFARMALDQLGEIRPFLLDGLLAEQDFIDREGLGQWLNERSLQHVADIPRLFKLLATEAWLRSWSGARSEATV